MGTVPFFAYVGIFLLLPTVIVVWSVVRRATTAALTLEQRRPDAPGRTSSLLQEQRRAVARSARSIGAVVGRSARLRRRDREPRRALRRMTTVGLRRARAVRRRHAGVRVHRHDRPEGQSRSVPARPRHDIYANGVWLYDSGPDPGLHLLPDPVDGAGVPAGGRRDPAAVAGGDARPRRHHLAVLAARRRPAAHAGVPRLHAAAVRQRVLRLRHVAAWINQGALHRAAADQQLADQRGRPRRRTWPRPSRSA